MPRSRNRIPRPPRQAPDPEPTDTDLADPDGDEWGSDPSAFEPDGQDDDELEDDDELGEPPPIPAAAQEPSTLPSERLAALGPPPSDTLKAEKWAHSVLMWQAYETMMSSLPETVRRKEVRTILRDAKGHVTDAARYDYMMLVERDRAEMESKKRGKAAARPVPVGPAGEAKIIPIRRDG